MTGTATTKCFADRLQDLIADSGKDVKTLASEIGISSGALSKYQNDKGEPGITALYKIAKYFGVTSDYLIGLSHNKTPENSNIGEQLGLTDSAIENLKILQTSLSSTRNKTLDLVPCFGSDDDISDRMQMVPYKYNLTKVISNIISSYFFSMCVYTLMNSIDSLVLLNLFGKYSPELKDHYDLTAYKTSKSLEKFYAALVDDCLANINNDAEMIAANDSHKSRGLRNRLDAKEVIERVGEKINENLDSDIGREMRLHVFEATQGQITRYEFDEWLYSLKEGVINADDPEAR